MYPRTLLLTRCTLHSMDNLRFLFTFIHPLHFSQHCPQPKRTASTPLAKSSTQMAHSGARCSGSSCPTTAPRPTTSHQSTPHCSRPRKAHHTAHQYTDRCSPHPPHPRNRAHCSPTAMPSPPPTSPSG